MWFKHLQVYQFADEFDFNLEILEEKLQNHGFQPCASILPMSMGWEAPINHRADPPFIYAANGNCLIRLKIEEKLLPTSIVRSHAEEKITMLESAADHKLSSKEKMTIRDEVYSSLLPKAFSKYSHMDSLIIPSEKLLIIDSSSRNKAEDFITFLRKTLGSLPVTLLDTIPITSLMTRWLRAKKLPSDLQLGETCTLHDSKADGATVRCSKHDLQSPNIHAFVNDGFEIVQLQLQWKQHLRFTLRDDASITQLKFTDAVHELVDDIHSEDAAQQQDAAFFIMTQILKDFLQTFLPLLMRKQ